MDEELLKALAGVQPLRGRKARARVALAPPPPPPEPAQTRRDERAALRESLVRPLSLDEALESGEELAYLRNGLARDVLRRLRGGRWVVEDALDLHGMTRDEAAAAVAGFLADACRRGRRCLRIVHGKGLRSKNREPVLKAKLRGWLERRDEVLAFCQAPAAQGGGGALLVLLRGKRGRG